MPELLSQSRTGSFSESTTQQSVASLNPREADPRLTALGSFRRTWLARQADEILEPLEMTDESLRRVMLLLEQNMERGLGRASNSSAIVKMFPSYVRDLPDSRAEGTFLALDLGGTNFRVLMIKLTAGSDPEISSEIFNVPDSIMTGPGYQLFDHIVNSIESFLNSNQLELHEDRPIPLGFTFSFPCKQKGLNVGILQMWTKGFSCDGVEGKNVVDMLEQAIARKGNLHVRCVAILNDTVGTLMSCAYEDPRCLVGLILGTGTNACYMEKLDKVELWDEDTNDPKQVIINTEWGAFGSDGCLDFVRTSYDVVIDDSSINPGEQIYEKMISGMYLGEIVRLVLVKLAESGCLFGGEASEQLLTEGAFQTKFVSHVESTDDLSGARRVLEELGVGCTQTDELQLVTRVCRVVSRRAARLASAGVAVLLNRINQANVTVGVDGSLFKYHPHFRSIMEEKINELLNTGLSFQLQLSHDGSGKGAALVAAVAERSLKEQKSGSAMLKNIVDQVV